MTKTRILITVKTYPTLSEKYAELVCTAGFREDGSWIRLYPIPFRKLDYANQYHKWQWIEIDVVKNTRDFRPESYRPKDLDAPFTLLEKIGCQNNWAERKSLVLNNVCTNMEDLIRAAKDKTIGTSLAVVKPKEIINFIWEPCVKEWDAEKLAKVNAQLGQADLFEEVNRLFKVVKKLPYKFSYIFTTDDGIRREMMIEDWELGQLYWKCLKESEDERIACQKVKEKYFDWMSKQRDLYFFLGTTRNFHYISPNPFIIIGAFYPPKVSSSEKRQLTLF